MDDVQFLKNIMNEVEKNFFEVKSTQMILSEYEYYREIIMLYAKQHNLLESILLLLDNNHSEESYILARSMVNNYFLIGFLINDNKNRSRLKRYKVQPFISLIYQLNNIVEIVSSSKFKDIKGIKSKFPISKIRLKIEELKKELENRGFKKEEKPFSIKYLAKHGDDNGLQLYSSFYADASKYEHSDISSLNIYKMEFQQNSSNKIFTVNLTKTNDKLKKYIYTNVEVTYCYTFIKILLHIAKNEKELENNYNMEKLFNIAKEMQIHLLSKK